jgi:glycosyltransferase involved in cell wall biosynthesis
MRDDSRFRLLCIGRDLAGGGAERVQLALLECLDRSDFDIRLFYLQDRGDLRHLIPSDLKPSFGVPAGRSVKLGAAAILNKLLVLARETDLVFAMMQGTPVYLAALVGRAVHRPVVGWMHSVWSKQLEEELAWWHRPVSRVLYPMVDRFLSVSEGAADDLRAFSPALRNRVTRVHNFLPLNAILRMADEPLPNWAAEVFKKRVVLGAGRLVRAKGFDVLIPAMARLLHRGHDLNLVILGEGPERARLVALARTLGVVERVFMPGFVPNPYPFQKRAEVFVLSSRQEGFGMVLLEALALGTCVVSSDCAYGPRSVLEGGRYGVLVPPDDIDSLAEGISAILKDPSRREAFRTLGQEYAQSFDASKNVPTFEDLLRSFTMGRGAR